jgi:hypothetical protein
MDIGFGAALALWFAAGVVFWAAFVVLGLRFRAARDEEAPAPSTGMAHGGACRPTSRPTPEQVLARSGR